MSFEEDTKKIFDFFDNKELQEIFEDNFIHKQRVKEAVDNNCYIEGFDVSNFKQELGLDK